MSTRTLSRRRPAKFRPGMDLGSLKLEDRTLLSTGGVSAAAIEPGAGAYVTQLYISFLDRNPDSGGLATNTQVAEQGAQGRQQAVNNFINSPEYRTNVIRGNYEDLLDRTPSQGEVDGWLARLDQGLGFEGMRFQFLNSDEYYAKAGGNSDGFIRSLYTDLLNRGPEAGGLTFWTDAIASGTTRSQVVEGILGSPEADGVFVDRVYAQFLLRTPDAGGRDFFIGRLAGAAGYEDIYRTITTSPEYVQRNQAVTDNLVETATAAGNFTILAQALEATGLVSTLESGGPFTVFAPTDAAFQALGQATLDALLADPDQLRQILLYHVVPGQISAPEVIATGLLTTVEGSQVGISLSNGDVRINDANITQPNVQATNGLIHVIDRVLTIPTNNILATATAAGNFTTLAAAVTAAGLTDTLNGPGPFTVLAPTDAAFAALPAGVLDDLLANPSELERVLLYHVIAGGFSSDTLVSDGRVTTVNGAGVDFTRTTEGIFVNESRVAPTNIVATNGVIQVLDRVLIPPPL